MPLIFRLFGISPKPLHVMMQPSEKRRPKSNPPASTKSHGLKIIQM